jgi:hypothetical protein
MREQLCVRFRWLLVVATLIATAFAGTPGWFRGTVVETDRSRADSGWIYVRGRDGGIRRVDISHARISYAEKSSSTDHPTDLRNQLIPGTEVRINAEQGSDGEWRAHSVEILRTNSESRSGPTTQPL